MHCLEQCSLSRDNEEVGVHLVDRCTLTHIYIYIQIYIYSVSHIYMIDIYIYRDRCLSSYLEYKLSDTEHGASGTRRAASERAKKEDSTTKMLTKNSERGGRS